MEIRDEIWNELKGIAPKLAALDKANIYRVPEGYFVQFKNAMLEKVKMSEAREEIKAISPELAKLNKEIASVPAGYFASFSTDILSRVRSQEVANELAGLAPTLSKLEKINLFEAPAGYFNALPAQMMEMVEAEQGAEKVRETSGMMSVLNSMLDAIAGTLFKPRYSIVWAGCVAVLITVMIFVKTETTLNVEQQLASLTTAELDAYMGAHADEFESVLDVSTSDKALLNQSSTVSFDKYMQQEVSDEELNDIVI